MNQEKARRALKKVALKEGVSVDEVRHEIEIAINEAANSPDPKVRAYWDNISARKGRLPTPEEAVLLLADRVTKKQHP